MLGGGRPPGAPGPARPGGPALQNLRYGAAVFGPHTRQRIRALTYQEGCDGMTYAVFSQSSSDARGVLATRTRFPFRDSAMAWAMAVRCAAVAAGQGPKRYVVCEMQGHRGTPVAVVDGPVVMVGA